jgi:phosphinothricin acetyltransferase
MNGLVIRDARRDDVPAMLAIYAPFVTDTPVSFEVDVPARADFEERVTKSQSQWAWLVAELDGRVAGYAYGSQFRARAAYRFSAEVSAYVDETARGKGVASALYRRLFEILAAKGYCNLYAGIVVPNDASVGFHKALGFEPIGIFHRAGWKFGSWHDVSWWERVLRDVPADQPGAIAPR